MATITDESNQFNTIQFIAWNSQYSASQGSQDFMGQFNTGVYDSTVVVVPFNTTILVTTTFNTYFKMQGFNTSTNSYEVWFSMGSPLLIPPSGHTLSNIEIVLTWIDR
jgi:hypothetical protein